MFFDRDFSPEEIKLKVKLFTLALEMPLERYEWASRIAEVASQIGVDRIEKSEDFSVQMASAYVWGTRKTRRPCSDKQGRKRGKPMGYSNITWSCPFFGWDAKRVVKCEAGRINFPDREAEKEHVHKYCADPKNWRQCSLAAYMNGYYARQEEEELEERKKQLIRQGGE